MIYGRRKLTFIVEMKKCIIFLAFLDPKGNVAQRGGELDFAAPSPQHISPFPSSLLYHDHDCDRHLSNFPNKKINFILVEFLNIFTFINLKKGNQT